MFSQRIFNAIALGAVAVLAGCSAQSDDGRPKPVPVNGLVLVDHQPSVGARVVFSPESHHYAAAGITDDEGRFQLQTFDADDGAVPGSFKVMVSNFEVIEHANGSVTENHFLPKKYRNPETSGLTAVVKEADPNEITLELTVPAGAVEKPTTIAD